MKFSYSQTSCQFSAKGVVFFHVLLLFLLASAPSAFASPDVLDEKTSARDSSRSALLKLVNNVHYTKLSNGLRVILYKRGVAPVFGGVVTARVGGVDEVQGHTGISHMLEHMAFKGTPEIGTSNFKKEKKLLSRLDELAKETPVVAEMSKEKQEEWQQIQKQLEEIWVTAEFTQIYNRRGATGMNATTGKELTNYFVALPRNSFEFWCWIESERIVNPVMRQFYRERDVVMEERRMRYDNSPGGKLYEHLLGVAFQAHPYRNPVIGYPFDISRLTAPQVAEFHRKYYVSDNIVVSIAGDIDPERDLPTIEKYFGRIPVGKAPALPKVEEPEQKGERVFSIEYEASPEFAIAYKKPQFPKKDDPIISVMLEVFAGGKISPLYKEMVQTKRIVTDISYFEAPGTGYDNLVVFSGTVRSPHTNKAVVKAFDQVLKDFQKKGVTQKQVDIAKRSIARDYLTGLASNLGLARDLASSELMFGDWKSLLTWFDLVMQVSAEDVNRVAREYLVRRTRTIGMVERKK